ncbi:hypothetical protein RvY_06377-2 [Ramazzottius varieornatus]|uniref:Uncharacterized protein n=1 Tax=Ramazzottius varieornatus TaxID=947166 RepID=A0A1D1UYB3_RAMVA|nr:hypothetical protein RvY_06377-2 [Ramazzottius varieornatus]
MARFRSGASDDCWQLQQASHPLVSTGKPMFNLTSSSNACCSLCHNVCSPDFISTCHFSPSATTASAVTSVDQRPSPLEIWSYGLPSVLVVCSCAALGLCLYPIMKTKFFQHVLTWMVGLAIGCLSGIAIFQLMPQAMEMPAESPAEIEQYLRKCLVIISAVFAFYVAERIFKMVAAQRRRLDSSSSTSPSSGIESRLSAEQEGDVLQGSLLQPSALHFQHSIKSSETTEDSGHFAEKRHLNSQDVLRRLSHDHIHFHGHDSAQPLKTIAWLILTGDSM